MTISSFRIDKLFNLSIVLFLLVLPTCFSINIYGQNTSVKESLVFEQQNTKDLSGSKEHNLSISGRNSTKKSKRQTIDRPTSQLEAATMNGVKIFVNTDSWYLVSTADLTNSGFDINTNSAKWQLISDGQEVPIKVNADRSISFYGIGKDTLHTDSTVYYLINGNSNGLRIPQFSESTSGVGADNQYFPVKVERKDRQVYLSSILNGERENWFASLIYNNASNFEINTYNVASSGQASVEIKLQGISSVDHLVNVRINNYDLGTANFSNQNYHQQTFNVPLPQLNEGNNQLTIQPMGGGSDVSALDAVSITYPRVYEAINNRLHFSIQAGQTVSVEGFTTDNFEVFEIINNQASSQMLFESEMINQTHGFTIRASNLPREFYAVANSNQEVPSKVEANNPSSLNSPSNQAEFVIIAPAEFNNAVQNLADLRQGEGMKTQIAWTEDIADEFGYGILSPESIRNFLQHAKNQWTVKPKYVLLFGDSSFDMRNYINGQNQNFIPTKLIETFSMETSSDGWLVDFDDDGVEDLAIGRIPAKNVDEANKAMGKIYRYDNDSFEYPKSSVLVADNYFEILNRALEDLLPSDVSSERIERWYITDTQMREEVWNKLNQNPTFVSYLGHGTTGSWSSGSIFNVNQTQELNNQKLSFYMLMTCLNGFTHNLYNLSLAENLVLAPNGAIAVWASSGSTYASGQIEMGQGVVSLTFPADNTNTRVGDVVRISKQSSNDSDARRTWQLFGDPTLIIK